MSRSWDRAVRSYQARAASLGGYFEGARESQILRIITDACDKGQVDYWRNYTTKVITIKGEKKLARTPSHQKGKPDVTVWPRQAGVIHVETKAPRGQLTDDQLRWRKIFEARGDEYHAPRTIEEAHALAARILEIGRLKC